MITKEELIERLQPYFEAGVLTDIIYTSDKICVFNYGDLRYVAFPCMLYNFEYPLGIQLPPDILMKHIENPDFFFELYKHMIKDNLQGMCHFDKRNLKDYSEFLKNIKGKYESQIDLNLNEEIRAKNNQRIK